MRICLVLALAAGLLLPASATHATLVGMDTAPLGDRNDPNVRSAVWDAFTQAQVPETTTYTFAGTASGDSTLTNLSLSQSLPHALGVQGSGLLNGGDVYYSSTFAQSWTLTATTAVPVREMVFQIKTANVPANQASLETLFRPTLAGGGAATFVSSTQVNETAPFNFTYYVLEYRWSGLDLAAGSSFEVTFALAGGQGGDFTRKPIDFVALDVSAVPEPGTAALLALGGLVAVGLARRRRP